MTRSIDRSLILQDCFSDLARRVGPPRQVCGFSDQTSMSLARTRWHDAVRWHYEAQRCGNGR